MNNSICMQGLHIETTLRRISDPKIRTNIDYSFPNTT
jgi:hypothetical protein